MQCFFLVLTEFWCLLSCFFHDIRAMAPAEKGGCIEYCNVPEFYAGKSVFITGGTGFLGKVIIEKILYSCPDVETIYALMREKKNFTIEQRLQHFLNCPVFDRIKRSNPQNLKKIVPILGDIGVPKLNLSPQSEELLLDKVSVVIHSAATVNFNETLRTAYDINLEGTRKILDLCQRMKQIKVFIHISTAYTHTSERVLEERLYPAPVGLQQLTDLIEQHGNDKNVSSTLLFGRPNTYTFTKCLAESAVNEHGGNIPTVIVRPSIVTSSKSEPIPGWVDSWNGATGMLYAIGKGFCRTLFAEKYNYCDLIPVDYVSNLIVVAAAKCHNFRKTKVLHCCSSSVNPINMSTLSQTFIEKFVQKGLNDIPFPYCFMFKYKWITYIIILIMEIIPAYLADWCLVLLNKPTRFVKLQTKVSLIRNVLSYFTSHSWIMQMDETKKLYASLSPEDARKFPFDPSDIYWSNYLNDYSTGIIKYLVNTKK